MGESRTAPGKQHKRRGSDVVNKTLRVSAYLCEEGVQDYEDVLRDDVEYEKVALRADISFQARLYVQLHREQPPAWLTLLNEGAAEDLGRLLNRSNAAVLVIRREFDEVARFFAITFGFGWALVNDDRYVRDFGVKVALNAIDPEQLVSLDLHTLEELPFHRRVQATQASPPSRFALDSYRDRLISVTGVPTSGPGKRVSGSDLAALTVKLDFDELGELCDWLFQTYQSRQYQQRFGWIDQLARVRERRLRGELDEELVRLLREEDASKGLPEQAWLAPPEVLEWTQIEGFWITGTGRRRDDLLPHPDLKWYLDGLRDRQSLDLEKLKRDKVQAFASADQPEMKAWAIYRSLIVSLERDGQLYVLVNGSWFEIAATLVKEIDDFVGGLEPTGLSLPPSSEDEHEPVYNARAAALDEDLCLLDRANIVVGGSAGVIESCDLLHPDGIFVHVKRYKGGSAALSHLFAQGAVSAVTFLREPMFRERLREKVANDVDESAAWSGWPGGDEAPRPSDYEVAYAIVASEWDRGAASLPFFSKLTLMRAARDLEASGYRVTLTRVPTEQQQD
jgi:uncharacterized protein (TIGR04141 family)